MNPYFNENTVLDYVKQVLGAPFNIIEFDDDYLINNIIVRHDYLKEFSRYFPKEERIILTEENKVKLNDYINQNSNNNLQYINSNRWYLNSENEILGVRDVISNNFYGGEYIYNDTILHSNPLDFSVYNLMSSIVDNKVSFNFYYPDILEVKGFSKMNNMVAILDVVHDKDLSSIPSSLHMHYNKFALYTAADAILHIRGKYNNLSTPFGEININMELIQSLADKKAELIQEFKGVGNLTRRGVSVFVG